MQPVIREIRNRHSLEFVFVHTGQHYDWNMSNIFIDELELPKPDVFLNVGSGSPGHQIARIFARSEMVLKKERPDIVLVEGDANSALGGALAAAKLKMRVGHVEAGCRSFDRNMPEEINRILIADLASINLAPTKTCVQNLLEEGISKNQICLTGHPIVDILHQFQNRIMEKTLQEFDFKPKEYYFVTVHREENVDNRARLKNIMNAFSTIAESRPTIFPMHPRTSKAARRFRIKSNSKDLIIVEPLGYLQALSLIKYSRTVLTDSGGIQQEAALLGTPCITLRASTEWVETVTCGINILAKSSDKIIAASRLVERNYDKIAKKFELARKIFGLPPVASKIVDRLEAVR